MYGLGLSASQGANAPAVSDVLQASSVPRDKIEGTVREVTKWLLVRENCSNRLARDSESRGQLCNAH